MTDRLKGVYVAFENDTREDDAEATIAAIRCLRGVCAVEALVTTPDDWANRQRIKYEALDKISAVLYQALLDEEHPAARWKVVARGPE